MRCGRVGPYQEQCHEFLPTNSSCLCILCWTKDRSFLCSVEGYQLSIRISCRSTIQKTFEQLILFSFSNLQVLVFVDLIYLSSHLLPIFDSQHPFTMRSLLPFFVYIICLFSYTLATNLPRIDRQPSPGKALYTIFPKNGTDISKTSEFVKNIVGTEDLLPWTNLQEQLVSWTVEASPDEVTQLRGYADVDTVVEFHPLEVSIESGTTRADRRAVVVTGLSERDNPPRDLGYLIFPRDGKNNDETSKTERFLLDVVGKDNVRPPLSSRGRLVFWVAMNSK